MNFIHVQLAYTSRKRLVWTVILNSTHWKKLTTEVSRYMNIQTGTQKKNTYRDPDKSTESWTHKDFTRYNQNNFQDCSYWAWNEGRTVMCMCQVQVIILLSKQVLKVTLFDHISTWDTCSFVSTGYEPLWLPSLGCSHRLKTAMGPLSLMSCMMNIPFADCS